MNAFNKIQKMLEKKATTGSAVCFQLRGPGFASSFYGIDSLEQAKELYNNLVEHPFCGAEYVNTIEIRINWSDDRFVKYF